MLQSSLQSTPFFSPPSPRWQEERNARAAEDEVGPGVSSVIRDGEPESAAVDRRIGMWTVLVSYVPLLASRALGIEAQSKRC